MENHQDSAGEVYFTFLEKAYKYIFRHQASHHNCIIKNVCLLGRREIFLGILHIHWLCNLFLSLSHPLPSQVTLVTVSICSELTELWQWQNPMSSVQNWAEDWGLEKVTLPLLPIFCLLSQAKTCMYFRIDESLAYKTCYFCILKILSRHLLIPTLQLEPSFMP